MAGAESQFPPGDRHARAFAGFRLDFELIRKPFGSAESEPEAAAGRKTVLQGAFDIGDPGTAIFEAGAQTAPAVALDNLDVGPSATAVDQSVARELAGGRDDLGLVNKGKAQLQRRFADVLPHANDVFGCADRKPIRFDRLSRHWFVQSRRYDSRSRSIPRSTFNAVRTPFSESPSSTSVIATEGCMPVTTVAAPSTLDIPAILPSMRPINESTISSEEMSIRTPLARVAAMRSVRSS